MISTRDLGRSFGGRAALDGLTLAVEPGEVLALLGPNGAGKTTTVRLLNGVLLPDRGQSRVLGMDPAVDGHEVRRRTGVMTENAGLDDRLTARENVVWAGQVRGLDLGVAQRRADELLERFGMGDSIERRTQGFSTGQRKRVALARALLTDPEVLFLDEPTSGLDPAATREVIDLIANLAGERGRAVILCTHFLAEAGQLADRMAILHAGRLQAFGRPEELAADLWPGLDIEIDLGAPATTATLADLQRRPEVVAAVEAPRGLVATVRDRNDTPTVVAALVGMGCPVYAASPRPRTLEDVYFAIADQLDAPGWGGSMAQSLDEHDRPSEPLGGGVAR